MECKDRNNRSTILLPYSFIPSMAAKHLRDAADKVCLLHVISTTSQLSVFQFYKEKKNEVK